MRRPACFSSTMPFRYCVSRLRNWLGVRSSATRIVGALRVNAEVCCNSGRNVKKLLADVANIADAFTQVVAGGERQLVADQLHVTNDRLRKA